jgi:formyltetrahydrofolate-dependent phosphoribosylglycinamide formyltransferase
MISSYPTTLANAVALRKTPDMSEPVRIAVLLSGTGRTLRNLLERIEAGSLNARIEVVISDRTDSPGLTHARVASIRTEVVSPNSEMSDRIFAICREENVQLVCMAGFLRLLKIAPDFSTRVLNIHPAMLPAFGGKGMYGHRVHEAVLASGATESGCTVHIADSVYDHGPIVLQLKVPVLPGDTTATLAERVFAVECEAYPRAIQMWAESIMK